MAPQPPQKPSARDTGSESNRRSARDRMRFGGLPPEKEKRGARPLLVAIGLHVVALAVLVRLVSLGHGLYDWLGLTPNADKIQEQITYVEPKPTEPKAVPKPKPPEKPVTPAPNAPSDAIPSGPPAAPASPVAAPIGNPRGDSSGTAGAVNAGIDPNIRGITPGTGDPRIWKEPHAIVGLPRDRAEGVDSIIGSVFRAAVDSLDSLSRVNATQRAGDWTKTDKNGNKWGWDGAGIRLGKVVIPNALLSLLPLNAQQAMSGNATAMSNERRLAYARAEILRMSERSVGEADFRKSIKELRERREREHSQPKPQETKALPPKADN